MPEPLKSEEDTAPSQPAPDEQRSLLGDCPMCHGPMEQGFLCYDSRVMWQPDRPVHIWQFKVGSAYQVAPYALGPAVARSSRCRSCHIIVFENSPA